MHIEDIVRELTKVSDALANAELHLTRENEANAALHLNERVLYSPLTVAVVNARESADRVLTHFTELRDTKEELNTKAAPTPEELTGTVSADYGQLPTPKFD